MIEPGALRTSGLPNTKTIPSHPAYADPLLPSQLAREWLANNRDTLPGDPRKAAEKIFHLTKLANPPQRLVLGHDAIELVCPNKKSIMQAIGRLWVKSMYSA